MPESARTGSRRRTPASTPQHPLIARLAQRRVRHRQRSVLYRAAFTLAGALVTLAGLVMLMAPGPAFVVVPAGLAMLSMEFAWAQRPLVWAIGKAEQAATRAARASSAQKAAGGVLVAGAAAGAVAWALAGDIPLLPF